jgi:hypothetical protein
MNLSNRINHVLQITRTKKADLARAIGVKPQVIQFLCNSQTQSSRFTFEIATALGLNTKWLATGEGEIFVADDPNRQFLNMYDKIPLLQGENLKNVCLCGKELDEIEIDITLPLKIPNQARFAIKMPDASMEPFIPSGSDLFIASSNDIDQSDHKFIFLYLSKFDTFAVREVLISGSSILLTPKNTDLFKTILFDNEVTMIGFVTSCSWYI